MFRAVESGKSRSIDQVIRKISKVLPVEEIKKKNDPTVNTVQKNDLEVFESVNDSSKIDTEKAPSVDFQSNEIPVSDKEIATDTGVVELNQGDNQKENKRQIQDENEIRKRVDALPDKLKKSLLDEFKVNFVSIEKIDPKQLI